MRSTVVLLGAIISSAANIIFDKVQPMCEFNAIVNNGCLRGQFCHEDNTCLPLLSSRADGEDASAYSANGQCGSSNDGLVCDPASTVYSGMCCSVYGWCGSTPAYCGDGCQSGCSNSVLSVSSASVYSADGQCGSSNNNLLCDPTSTVYSGSCCSVYGWCGSTPAYCSDGCQSGCSDSVSSVSSMTQEPVITPATSTSSSNIARATLAVTTDGTCGAANSGTVCGDWPQGSCCSMYGFCGNTTAHCGEGCQSGPCLNGAEVPTPGPVAAPANSQPGMFNVIGQSGVPAMHAGLLPNGRVVFLDKVENYTQVVLDDGQYAYSAEYNPDTNTVVGLSYKTNAFCSGGSFLPNGTFISVGGNAPLTYIDPTVGDGFSAIRYLTRSATDESLDGESWVEQGNALSSARWYASVQTMPDGSLFVASGSLNGLDPTVLANNNPTYEILNAQGVSSGISVPMSILEKTQPYYMYPFMHLLSDGSLFIFVSKSSELFNVASNTTTKTFPDLPGDFRTYPNTGGSVLLPLSSADNWSPDIVICGGGAYQDITSPTDSSCGRIQPLADDALWEMDSMPEGRGMVEGTLLPDGTVLWVNGCNQGAQGFGLAQGPTLEVLIYDPAQPLGQRWSTGASSTIPRLYHSVALLLLDGTLMIAGSNPVQQPVLTPDATNPYATEFRVEIYTPPYLAGDNASQRRPTNVALSSKTLTADSSAFTASFSAPAGAIAARVALYHGGFVTHSLHMSHRMAFLDAVGWVDGSGEQTLTVSMPPSNDVAPPGPYVVYVVVDGVPAIGQFVQVA